MLAGCTVGVSHPATDITDSRATLHGDVFSTAAGEVDYWFRYGSTTDYGQSSEHHTITLTGEDQETVTERIQGLTAGTGYHFQLCVQHHTEEPDRVVCLADESFTTEPVEPTRLSIIAEPDLYPSFTPGATDYVTRCDGDPVTVDVGAPAGTQVAVDGQTARSGRFSQDVPLSVGQSFTFSTATGTGTATYHVRCLPGDFPNWTFSRSGTPSQDWTLLALSKGAGRYVTFIDRFGVPVWWYKHSRTPLDASLLSDDTVAFARGAATRSGPTTRRTRSADSTGRWFARSPRWARTRTITSSGSSPTATTWSSPTSHATTWTSAPTAVRATPRCSMP